MARKCPICEHDISEGAERFKPFCSKRCADVDLGRWLNGGYAIPADDQDDEEDSPPAEEPETKN